MATSHDTNEDNTIYKAVVNQDEQYSIWPADRENALGWDDAGKQGTRQEVLDYIQEVWTDMRPSSLRQKTAEMGDPALGIIRGTDGDDSIQGSVGNDQIFGLRREDTISGNSGNDVVHGEEGNDKLYGGDGNDVLYGEQDQDWLDGGNGDDTVYGGAGRDALFGSVGNDILTGGGGGDTFRFERGDGTDRITDFQNKDTIELGMSLLKGYAGALIVDRDWWLDETIRNATVEDGNTVFHFPAGEVLIIENVSNPQQLRDDLQVIW